MLLYESGQNWLGHFWHGWAKSQKLSQSSLSILSPFLVLGRNGLIFFDESVDKPNFKSLAPQVGLDVIDILNHPTHILVSFLLLWELIQSLAGELLS